MSKLFDFRVTLRAPENAFRYMVGQTLVGCLQHEQVVWSLLRAGWQCPVCGFVPPDDAEAHPLTVTRVDYANGKITVG